MKHNVPVWLRKELAALLATYLEPEQARLINKERILRSSMEGEPIMPRGRPRLNNGPVDVPPPPSQEEKTATTLAAVEEAKAYRARGKETPAVPERPFGPGADYPRYSYQVRLYDPATRTVSIYAASDIPAVEWADHIERMIESGLEPCNYVDAPKAGSIDAVDAPLERDKAIGRQRRMMEEEATEAQRNFLKRLRSDEWDAPDLTKREASELIEELTATARSRTRGRR